MDDLTAEEVDTWRANRDYLLWREAADCQGLFRYDIQTKNGVSVLCQHFESRDLGDGRTELTLDDVWVFDAIMACRFVSSALIVTREYQVLDLKGSVGS